MRTPGAPGVPQIQSPGHITKGNSVDRINIGNGTDMSVIVNQLDDANGMGNTMDSFIQGAGAKLYQVNIRFIDSVLFS